VPPVLAEVVSVGEGPSRPRGPHRSTAGRLPIRSLSPPSHRADRPKRQSIQDEAPYFASRGGAIPVDAPTLPCNARGATFPPPPLWPVLWPTVNTKKEEPYCQCVEEGPVVCLMSNGETGDAHGVEPGPMVLYWKQGVVHRPGHLDTWN